MTRFLRKLSEQQQQHGATTSALCKKRCRSSRSSSTVSQQSTASNVRSLAKQMRRKLSTAVSIKVVVSRLLASLSMLVFAVTCMLLLNVASNVKLLQTANALPTTALQQLHWQRQQLDAATAAAAAVEAAAEANNALIDFKDDAEESEQEEANNSLVVDTDDDVSVVDALSETNLQPFSANKLADFNYSDDASFAFAAAAAPKQQVAAKQDATTSSLVSSIERRRLDRSRASEPAPWQRQQPMRRSDLSALPIDATSAVEENVDDNYSDRNRIGDDNNDDDDDVDVERKLTTDNLQARYTRQLPSEVLDELLGELIAAGVNNHRLVDSALTNANTRNNNNNNNNNNDNNVAVDELGIERESSNLQQGAKSSNLASLVQADDEVAFDSAASQQQQQQSAAHAALMPQKSAQLLLQPADSNSGNSGNHEPTIKLQAALFGDDKQQAANALKSSPLADLQQQQQQQSSSGADSFHVVEDIDRIPMFDSLSQLMASNGNAALLATNDDSSNENDAYLVDGRSLNKREISASEYEAAPLSAIRSLGLRRLLAANDISLPWKLRATTQTTNYQQNNIDNYSDIASNNINTYDDDDDDNNSNSNNDDIDIDNNIDANIRVANNPNARLQLQQRQQQQQDLRQRLEAALELPQNSILGLYLIDEHNVHLLASLNERALSSAQLAEITRRADYLDGHILIPLTKLRAIIALDAQQLRRQSLLLINLLKLRARQSAAFAATLAAQSENKSRLSSSKSTTVATSLRQTAGHWLQGTSNAHLLALVLGLAASIATVNLLLVPRRNSTTRNTVKHNNNNVVDDDEDDDDQDDDDDDNDPLTRQKQHRFWPSLIGAGFGLKSQSKRKGRKLQNNSSSSSGGSKSQVADCVVLDCGDDENNNKSCAEESAAAKKRRLAFLSEMRAKLAACFVNAEQQQQQQAKKQCSSIDNDADSSHQVALQATNNDKQQQMRSSSSYVKSLIDTLARVHKARACDNSADSGVEFDEQSSTSIADAATINDTNGNCGDSFDAKSAVSQMDISAAHTLLAFLERHLDDSERVKRDWQELCAGQASASVDDALISAALAPENAHKNRSLDSLPLDKSRVRLRNGSCSYINASFLFDDEPRRPTHIIAQAPTEQTIGDFWQMLWEQKVSVVVMLTRLSENGQSLCQCYWPTSSSLSSIVIANNNSSNNNNANTSTQRRDSTISNTSLTTTSTNNTNNNVSSLNFKLGDSKRPLELEVLLVSEHVTCNDYVVRNMCVQNKISGETRTLTQFHYLAWPEFGIPKNAQTLLSFRRKVNKCYRLNNAPIVIHCSNGIGRSGTYALLDITLNRIAKGAKEINIAATLEHLREQRANLVQTKAQFEFVLVSVCEEIQFILNALPQ